MNLLETRKVLDTFRVEINRIFEKTGLQFTLTSIQRVSEQGTRELLEEAIMLFKTPHPSARRDSVEKIWDALEV